MPKRIGGPNRKRHKHLSIKVFLNILGQYIHTATKAVIPKKGNVRDFLIMTGKRIQ